MLSARYKFFLRYDLPALAYAIGIFIISHQSFELPEDGWLERSPDYVLHAVLYFGLTWLVMRSICGPGRQPELFRAALIALLLVSLYGALDEFHQSFVPGRKMDIRDWIGDTAGAVAGVAIFVALRLKNKKLTHI